MAMARFAAWDERLAGEIIGAEKPKAGAMLPILHALQETFGYVDRAAVPMIAEALNVSRAEVHGVLTFYHDFHAAPIEGPVLKLCRAESCQSMGSEDLVAHLSAAHGLTPDKSKRLAPLHVETVYCLGNCALSPSALFDGQPMGRLTPQKLDRLISEAEARA
jgi:formate dehydrogenase subunit gamma